MSASQNGSPKSGIDSLTSTVSKIEANWNLRRLQAKFAAEFDFLRRETVQLCQKNFIKPSIESIDLTEEELRFVKDSKETKLREIVTKSCGSTIKHLMNQKVLSFPFNEPVNTDLYRDYLSYVETPMDFGTIKNKIEQYKHPREFEKDVRLVFENAKKYNAPETEVREMARILEQKFEEKWSKSVVPKLEELKTFEADEHVELKQCKADSVIREAESRVHECCKLLLKRLQTLHEEIVFTQCLASSQCGYVNQELRLRLGWELATLPPEHFQRAANLLITRHPGLVATMKKNTIDLDISKIDSLTFWQLKDFVNQCTKEGVYDDKSENSTEAEQQDRKRQKRTKPLKESVVTSDSLSTSRQEVQWPQVPFGVGLKSYDAEIEPFIPLRVDDQSLPFSRFFNSRRDLSNEDANKSPISGTKRKIDATQSGVSGGFAPDRTNPTKTRKETASSLLSTIPTTISELRPPTIVVSKGDVSSTTPAQSSTFSTFFAANLNSVGGQSIFSTPQPMTSLPPPPCTAPTTTESSKQRTPDRKE